MATENFRLCSKRSKKEEICSESQFFLLVLYAEEHLWRHNTDGEMWWPTMPCFPSHLQVPVILATPGPSVSEQDICFLNGGKGKRKKGNLVLNAAQLHEPRASSADLCSLLSCMSSAIIGLGLSSASVLARQTIKCFNAPQVEFINGFCISLWATEVICCRDNLGLTFAEASCFCSLTKQSRKKREKKKEKEICVCFQNDIHTWGFFVFSSL